MKKKLILMVGFGFAFAGTNSFAQGRSGFNTSVDGKSGPGYTAPSTISEDDILVKSSDSEIRSASYSIKVKGSIMIKVDSGTICDDAFKNTDSATAKSLGFSKEPKGTNIEIKLPIKYIPPVDNNATYGGYSSTYPALYITQKAGCVVSIWTHHYFYIGKFKAFFADNQSTVAGKKLFELLAAVDESINTKTSH